MRTSKDYDLTQFNKKNKMYGSVINSKYEPICIKRKKRILYKKISDVM